MEKITMYSSGCPRCKTLKKKLDDAGIQYETFTDVQKMIDMGFTDVPVLEVDGQRMQFSDAIKWVRER